MIRANVQVDRDVLDAFADAARSAPKLTSVAYNRALVGVRRQILDAFQKEPGAPSYPLRWKSDRQRKFVMAKLRREGNLPYRRTGKLLDSYEVTLIADENGGVLQVTNKSPNAVFVVGDWAQPFHLDTGWVQMATVVSEFDEVALDILIETWFTLTDPYAGVPQAA